MKSGRERRKNMCDFANDDDFFKKLDHALSLHEKAPPPAEEEGFYKMVYDIFPHVVWKLKNYKEKYFKTLRKLIRLEKFVERASNILIRRVNSLF